ncbi:MAG TPA: terminase small subunit [Abditibacterium sp.]
MGKKSVRINQPKTNKSAASKPTAKPKTKPKATVKEPKIAPSAFSKLTDKQKMFVLEYFRCWNATKAARLAGYSDPECSGYENRQKPAIRAAIAEKLEQNAMPADEVLHRLAQQARGEHGAFYKFFSPMAGNISTDPDNDEDLLNLREQLRSATPYLDFPGLYMAGLGHLIKKFKTSDGQITEVEFYDSQAALTLIGRHHKLFTDKVEHSGSIATPISEDDTLPLDGLDRSELNRRIGEKIKAPRNG